MKNIVLIGFMGSGKSTVGRILAGRLERRFVDTDAQIEERTGKSIERIFGEDGEERFRELERRVVETVCSGEQQIISAGGGVVLGPENIRRLKEGGGTVVYMRLSEEELVERAKRLRGRPLLGTGDREASVRDLLKVRKELYENAADVIVDMRGMRPEQAADAIEERLGLD